MSTPISAPRATTTDDPHVVLATLLAFAWLADCKHCGTPLPSKGGVPQFLLPFARYINLISH